MPDGAQRHQLEIVRREDFSEVTYLLEVHHPLLAKAARPGQFVIVMSHEHGERIPLTIADFDAGAGTVTLVIQAVGKTTRDMQQPLYLGVQMGLRHDGVRDVAGAAEDASQRHERAATSDSRKLIEERRASFESHPKVQAVPTEAWRCKSSGLTGPKK